jgi:hypothetical protein
MDNLIKDARKNSLWHLLSSTTGYSKIYCRKVLNNQRNQQAKGAKIIINKYNELKKVLS